MNRLAAVGAWGVRVLGALWLAQAPLQAQSVALRGPEVTGQGMARPRGIRECFVITPLHVVADAGSVRIVAEGGEEREAVLRQRYERWDLGILEPAAGAELDCAAWSVPANLPALLRDGSVVAVLRWVENDGSLSFEPVWIRNVGSDHITVAARDRPLQAGMSGSQLLVGGAFTGVLLSVDPADGNGRVLRVDVMDRVVNGFFAPARNREPDTSAAPLGVPASEPNLWLRVEQSVLLGDRNTSFGILHYQPIAAFLNVRMNDQEFTMDAGTRLPFPDSRGECHIIYMRTDDPDRDRDGEERHGFAVVCTPNRPPRP
jgi:hypothetical protein